MEPLTCSKTTAEAFGKVMVQIGTSELVNDFVDEQWARPRKQLERHGELPPHQAHPD